jgi:hypothetical protein
MPGCNTREKISDDSMTLAEKAKAWVESNEGQEKIRRSLDKALEVTTEFRKKPPVEVQSYRVPFTL